MPGPQSTLPFLFSFVAQSLYNNDVICLMLGIHNPCSDSAANPGQVLSTGIRDGYNVALHPEDSGTGIGNKTNDAYSMQGNAIAEIVGWVGAPTCATGGHGTERIQG